MSMALGVNAAVLNCRIFRLPSDWVTLQTMNTLVKDKECMQVMRELAQEMQQANIIDEVLQEVLEVIPLSTCFGMKSF